MAGRSDGHPVGLPLGMKFINGGDRVAARSDGNPIGLPLDPGGKCFGHLNRVALRSGGCPIGLPLDQGSQCFQVSKRF
ncbi:hypothetical protein HanXRQr2_Chr14g0648311 [Helianthus annuus]|uniref:Uncharacterized protein n=1 Tax=Helianthus annuus TaxID=4232 RepID=A0A9K3E9H3_HELAN|nr:hypothetical protein HanXRQr2_Chr14g0648311 [Helianthus annuus]